MSVTESSTHPAPNTDAQPTPEAPPTAEHKAPAAVASSAGPPCAQRTAAVDSVGHRGHRRRCGIDLRRAVGSTKH